MDSSSERTLIAPLRPTPPKPPPMATAPEIGTAVDLPLDDLDPNPFQPRTAMDERALTELVDGIRAQGLLQPISVRRVGQRYQVIAGHRRLEAFKRLRAENPDRYARIPAHWRTNVGDEAMAVLALQENLQRDDLPPLDSAFALLRFQETYQLSTDELAKRTGLEADRVKRLLRLGRAPKVVQAACGEGVMVGAPGANAEAPKRERARLDLMAAIEFAKLHAHAAKSNPKRADERVSRAIERALAERWPFRRIQTWCRNAIAGRDEHTGTSTTQEDNVPIAPLFVDGPKLEVFRSRIQSAAPDELAALRTALETLLSELPES